MYSSSVGDLPKYEIMLGGLAISEGWQVMSITVESEAFRIPWAEITFLDGDFAAQKYPLADSGRLSPGTEVKITMGYLEKPSTQKTVFEGLITQQTMEANSEGCTVTIVCRHKAVLMTRQRNSAVFKNKSDLDAIKAVFGKHQGVKLAQASKPSGLKHPELIQYWCTDWDFACMRAEAAGLLILPQPEQLLLADNASLHSKYASKAQDFNFNVLEVFQFEFMVEGDQQYSRSQAEDWDIRNQQISKPSIESGDKVSPGNLYPDMVARKLGGSNSKLRTGASLAKGETKAWSKAEMVRSRNSFFRGRIQLQGASSYFPGLYAKIYGMGAAFAGRGLITGVRQRLDTNGWVTDIQFGLNGRPFWSQYAVADAPAAGLLPAVHGLQVGLVKAFEKDEDGFTRVRVALPAMGGSNHLIWARLASPEAGKGGKDGTSRGWMFRPEVDDEVVVGFVNDDPRNAIVLGSLFNPKNMPVFPVNDKNPQKGLVTKLGSSIVFDDDKNEIRIHTRENTSLRMNEEKGEVEIVNKKADSKYVMNDSGIQIQFKGSKFMIQENQIILECGGSKISLGNSGVEMKSAAAMQLEASTAMDLKANGALGIQGSTVELK